MVLTKCASACWEEREFATLDELNGWANAALDGMAVDEIASRYRVFEVVDMELVPTRFVESVEARFREATRG